MSEPARTIVLASESSARKQLLDILQLPFICHAAYIDETPLADETAADLVQRLAQAKAHAVAKYYPDAVIIGADEVGTLAGQIIGKPRDHQHAVQQWQQQSGQCVDFFTGLCVLDTQTQKTQSDLQCFSVTFRRLSLATIERYLARTQPYHCAASFKVEGLGLALCAHCAGRDPTSLIGLPLMQLAQFLERVGVTVI